MPKIFVVGSFVVGMTIRVSRMPVPGENLVGDSFDMGPGGKGTNQAIAASRLGANVGLLACLGNDIFADQARALYEREGVSTKHIHAIDSSSTGVGFVTLLPNGENWIEVDLGANMGMTLAHVAAAEDEIAACDWVMCQFEVPTDVVAYSMALAHKHRKRTLLNPAPARRLAPEYFQHGDLLTPNESEARVLLGLPPDDPTPTIELARRLLDFGIGQVVVTRGRRGAVIVDADGVAEVFAPTIQMVDPTGAGDSFNAALVFGLGEGLSLPQAVRRACFAGAYTATHLGVIAGLPTRDELESFVASHSLKGAP
jgi:ribokinase